MAGRGGGGWEWGGGRERGGVQMGHKVNGLKILYLWMHIRGNRFINESAILYQIMEYKCRPFMVFTLYFAVICNVLIHAIIPQHKLYMSCTYVTLFTKFRVHIIFFWY